jgi:signal transduction histidine kinase
MHVGEAPLQERSGALETLRPMAAVASAIMVGFFFYNLVDFPPGVREVMMTHDALTAMVSAFVWWRIRRKRVREENAHAVATGLIVLIASNILLAMWLLREPFHAIYMCVLLVGAGAGMTIVGWGAGVVALLWAGTLPVLFAVTTPVIAVRYLFVIGATSVVSLALIVLRARNLSTLEHFAALDRQQRRALNHALADLDAKVALRTGELQAANAALQTQIDERERAEREARLLSEQLLHAQRLDSLGRLAGGVAHDFNNLLTVIRGNLHVALEELPAVGDREPLEDALGASERAANLTRQLLAFGRKQVIERTVFDVGKQVEDIARLLQRVLGERIEIHMAVEARDLWVNADPNQIEQVIMNLTTNARDAMPEGGSCFLEVARVMMENEEFIRLRIRDTGSGMAAETRERIFEPFFTTKPAGEGTGLGLATAYGVVQQHGGAITVESSPGAGSTFDVLLPGVRTPAGSMPAVSAPATVEQGSETILLVEDDAAVRRVAERFLRRQGYDLLVAASGTEALELVEQSGKTVDLLFTDVMMPGMNGFELASHLRAVQPTMQVMFVSGYTGDYLETQAGELPTGTHFVYKPFEPASTARMIRSILDQRAGTPS